MNTITTISHDSSYIISEYPNNKLLEKVSSKDKIGDMSSDCES